LRRGWPSGCSSVFARDAWLQIQQLQLQVAQRLAALAVLRDPLLTKTFFQYPDLQLRKLQRTIFGFQLLLELRDHGGNHGIVGRWHDRLCRRAHDVSVLTSFDVDM
jgi:hypothetical protein